MYSIVPLLTVGYNNLPQLTVGVLLGTVLTSTISRGTPRYIIVPLLTVGVLLGTVLYVYCQ